MEETILKQKKELSDSTDLAILTGITFAYPIILSGILTSIIFMLQIIRKYNFLDTHSISGFDAMSFTMWGFMIYSFINLATNVRNYNDELELKPFYNKPEHKWFKNTLSIISIVLALLVTIIFYIGQKVIR